jgi:hypothetical protein
MFILSDVNQSNYARKLGSKDKKKRKEKDIYQVMLDKQNKQIRRMTPQERENAARKGALIGGGIGVIQGGALGVLSHSNDTIGESFYGRMHGNRKVTIPAAIAATIIGSAGNAGLSYYLAKRRQKQALNSK